MVSYVYVRGKVHVYAWVCHQRPLINYCQFLPRQVAFVPGQVKGKFSLKCFKKLIKNCHCQIFFSLTVAPISSHCLHLMDWICWSYLCFMYFSGNHIAFCLQCFCRVQWATLTAGILNKILEIDWAFYSCYYTLTDTWIRSDPNPADSTLSVSDMVKNCKWFQFRVGIKL